MNLTAGLANATATGNRSHTVDVALKAVFNDPELLLVSLKARLHRVIDQENETIDTKTHRVTVTMDHLVLEKLEGLAKRCRLPGDEIIRLALEAHMFKS